MAAPGASGAASELAKYQQWLQGYQQQQAMLQGQTEGIPPQMLADYRKWQQGKQAYDQQQMNGTWRDSSRDWQPSTGGMSASSMGDYSTGQGMNGQWRTSQLERPGVNPNAGAGGNAGDPRMQAAQTNPYGGMFNRGGMPAPAGGNEGYNPTPYDPGQLPAQTPIGDFAPNMPGVAPANSYYNPFPTPTTEKPTDPQMGTMPYWINTKNQDAMAAMANYYLPQQQLQQQAAQYGLDFGEMQRRFNIQQGWQMKNDQYSQALAGRQQGLSEWQAQEAAKQYGSQLGFEQLRNQQQFGLQGQQFGFQQEQAGIQNEQANRSFGLQSELGRGEAALKQQQFGAENEWRKTQAQLQREQQAGALTQARYGAFGRASAPGGRMAHNW